MVREKMVIIKSLIKELKSHKMQFNVEHLHVTSKKSYNTKTHTRKIDMRIDAFCLYRMKSFKTMGDFNLFKRFDIDKINFHFIDFGRYICLSIFLQRFYTYCIP